MKLKEGSSLIIFDEIQKFPQAREAIKYLVQDGRYASGSCRMGGDTGLLISHAFSEAAIKADELYRKLMHDKDGIAYR